MTGLVKVTISADALAQLSAEDVVTVQRWCDEAAKVIEEQFHRDLFNLMAYGTTNPHGELPQKT